MTSKAITIHVNPEAARFYEAASAEEKRKLDVLLNLKLTEATQSEQSLEGLMRDISRNAEARGLTPEKLQAL